MENICPVCKKSGAIPEVVFRNVEAYGGDTYHKVACQYCKSPLNVSMSKKVVLNNISIGDFVCDDWNEKCVKR